MVFGDNDNSLFPFTRFHAFQVPADASLHSAPIPKLYWAAQTASLIFDTDMESDVDNVGALAILHGLADHGEVEILGTIAC